MTANPANQAPIIPSTSEIHAAILKRFNETEQAVFGSANPNTGSFRSWLLAQRDAGADSGSQFPPIQKDEVQKGTPEPRVSLSVGVGRESGKTSQRTATNGREVKVTFYRTPIQIKCVSRTDTQADSVITKACSWIEEKNLEVCGGQKFVYLFRNAIPISLKEGDELYSTTAIYMILTETETYL